jgi:hypothetical protein
MFIVDPTFASLICLPPSTTHHGMFTACRDNIQMLFIQYAIANDLVSEHEPNYYKLKGYLKKKVGQDKIESS